MSYTLSGGRIEAEKDSVSPVRCELCTLDLTYLAVDERMTHYNNHLDDNTNMGLNSASLCLPMAAERVATALNYTHESGTSSRTTLSNSTGKDKDGSQQSRWNKMMKRSTEKDLFWYPSQDSDPPRNFTPGLVPLLRLHLLKSHASGHTRRAVLCYDRAVLVTRQVWDAGWGCGYRNFLMACTVLMDQPFQPTYFSLLKSPILPGVRNLQTWIEMAWKDGYDPVGAEELRGKLVGTSRWLGTADLQTAFTSRGIPSQLVDFDTSEQGIELLTNWIVDYFGKDQKNAPSSVNDLGKSPPVMTSSRMPVILQWQGHSCTIVGYEVTGAGVINLLKFDPSFLINDGLRQAALDIYLSEQNEAFSSRKRAPAATSNPIPLKRSRSSVVDNDDVIVLEDTEKPPAPIAAKAQASHLKPGNVLRPFRINPKRLEKYVPFARHAGSIISNQSLLYEDKDEVPGSLLSDARAAERNREAPPDLERAWTEAPTGFTANLVSTVQYILCYRSVSYVMITSPLWST
ncbi:unnamed protein product [Mycena citricolor]|uniref:UFSP1/2/DUB catalytic domain-containing protein n=1 Tax=Mycena citricolor TaxID=2018698 RepID=A0AAD2Q6I5_9AGAR|nr:unnamed protein product [Mycena citricolor]